jgi:hypothetical protein
MDNRMWAALKRRTECQVLRKFIHTCYYLRGILIPNHFLPAGSGVGWREGTCDAMGVDFIAIVDWAERSEGSVSDAALQRVRGCNAVAAETGGGVPDSR